MESNEVYRGLVEHYKTSIQRTRSVFLVLNVVSVIFIVGYFNHRLTWLRHIVPPSVASSSLPQGGTTAPNRPEDYLELTDPGTISNGGIDLRRELVEQSINGDFKFVKFNLIGTKVFVDDLPIIGGMTLMVILTWFQYVIRREKGVAVVISKKVQKETDPGAIEYLFHGTAFNEIFNSVDGIDRPSDPNFIDNSESSLLKGVRRFMLYAPTIVLALIVGHDFVETFIQHNVVLDGKAMKLISYLSEYHTDQLIEVYLRLLVSIGLIVFAIQRTRHILMLNSELGRHMKIIEDRYLALEQRP